MVNLCRLAVEVIVALQDDALADPVLFERERARAVGVVRPCIAARLYIFAVDHESGGICELGEEVRLGGVYGDLQRALVYGGYAADRVGFARQNLFDAHYIVKVCACHGRGEVRIGGAIERIDEILRRNIRAVVKLGVVQDMEGIDRAVIADVPAFRYVRHNLQFGAERYKSAEDLMHYACGDVVGCLVRVERGRV